MLKNLKVIGIFVYETLMLFYKVLCCTEKEVYDEMNQNETLVVWILMLKIKCYSKIYSFFWASYCYLMTDDYGNETISFQEKF